MRNTRAMLAEVLCRSSRRDDIRLGAFLFSGAVAFLLVMF